MNQESLGKAIPVEQARVREILGNYKALGPKGAIGAMLIEQSLRDMDEAVMSGVLPRMIAAYKELRGIN